MPPLTRSTSWPRSVHMADESPSLFKESLGLLADLVEVEVGTPLRLALDDLKPDPDQPRREFSKQALAELAVSIEAEGVLQPITVRPANDQGIYVIRHGERRYRAALLAKGVKDIPAFISRAEDGSYAQMIENIQREDLSPMDIGQWIRKRRARGEKAGDIAKLLGKPPSFVSNHARLPALPPYILALYAEDVLRSPRALADLERASQVNEPATARFCRQIQARGGPTNRQIKMFLSGLKTAASAAKTASPGAPPGGAAASPSSAGEPPAPAVSTAQDSAIQVIHRPKVIVQDSSGRKGIGCSNSTLARPNAAFT